MPTRFITLFTARTGSTWLMDALHRHPWVTALSEELGASKQLTADAQREWLETFYGRRGALRLAVGFKTKLWYLHDRDHLRDTISRRSVRVVHLTRRNTLRAAVSGVRSHERHAVSGAWNARRDDAPLPPSVIDLAELDRKIDLVERTRDELAAFVATLEAPTTGIVYEDLVADRTAQLRRLASFLRTPLFASIAGRTQFTKNTPADWDQAVANMDELRAHIAGSAYEPMLDQP
ncbi:MAG: hypothetical protein AAF937_12615 [Planctomycetota bacterium]